MDDLDKYIEKRKKQSPKFAQNYEEGYEQFKIGVLLKQARLDAGLTQEAVANKLKTGKSAISRIENHAEDIRLSTLVNYAQALGKSLKKDSGLNFLKDTKYYSKPDMVALFRNDGCKIVTFSRLKKFRYCFYCTIFKLNEVRYWNVRK